MDWFCPVLFWLSFFTLVYVYAGYLLLLKALSFFYSQQHTVDETYQPTVTILFSAHNEETSLPHKIESIRRLNYPQDKIQVLAASDASTDGTAAFLSSQPDIEALILPTHGGKNVALNQLIPNATGELLFFTDANTVFHPDCLQRIARHYANPRVGCVTGNLVFTHEADWNPVGRSTGLYWRYENGIKALENQLGSVLVGGGSLLTARRGRIQTLHPRIANDLEIPMRLGAAGDLVLYEKDGVGFEKPHTDVREELRRTSRIVARGLRGFGLLFPVILQRPFRLWQFLSHKFLRWLTLPIGLCLWGSAACLQDRPFAFFVFWAGAFLLLGACLGLLAMRLAPANRFFKPFTILGHLLVMYTGASWGLLLTLFGKTPAVWTIPQSSR